jgi:hypothetical protein
MRPLTGPLSVANRTIRETISSFEDAVARRRQARRGIEAVDKVLEAVEQHHLAMRPRLVLPLTEWIACLEEEGGLSIPGRILELRNTVLLHAALMDWQDELLDAALPGRAQFTRADEEYDAQQRPLSIWLNVA